MRVRRLTSLLAVAGLTATALIVAAAPSQAADIGTITVTGASAPYSYSPSSLPGSVGDTFTVIDATTGGAYIEVGTYSGDTGVVSVGSQACNPLGSQATCRVLSGAGTTYTISSLGTVTLSIQGGGSPQMGPIVLGAPSATSAPALVASQPPSVTATPGNGVVQLAISPGTGGTAPAKLYGIKYRATSSCPAGRTLTPRPAADSTGQCAPCPAARALVPRPNFDALIACPAGSASVAPGVSGSATTTIPGLENGREYSFSVWEMTTDQLWSGATTVTSIPTAAAICSTLSVDVTQPGGKDAATVTPTVSGGTSPTVYPFIAPPYGGAVSEPAMGAWTSTTSTGAAGGEVATFTPRTDKPCPITVTAPEGAKLSMSTGGAWNAGSASLTVYSGTPVYVFGTKTGDYTISFKAGSGSVLNAAPKVRIGTVPQAAYNVAVSPASQTVDVNSSTAMTVSVTDAFGNPVPGAEAVVAASGQVLLGGSVSAQAVTTGATGGQTITVTSASSAGNAVVTAAAPAGSTAWAWQTGYAKPSGFADPVKAAPATITVSAPITKSISITDSGRSTVSGKPGVYARGTATGFAAGDTLKVFVRFPGQTEYTEGTARPVIDANGAFEWQRKTGKKTYVYLTNNDGTVTSNRVIIAAQ